MFYPLKFEPVFKDYIWGGRNLERLGKSLPEGITAESWEISSHKDGMSIIGNGDYKGTSLADFVDKHGRKVIGNALPEKYIRNFPLLIKLIDANDRLSVQVHPDDKYAFLNENGENGKNEMWYIISAEEGASLIYDVKPGVTKDMFMEAIREEKLERCLNTVKVKPGDVINIPAGLIHAIGKGIVLAEIQQNSNATYRVYDFGRVDKNGNKRPLHIEKAMDVIDFNSGGRREKYSGLPVEISKGLIIRYLAAAGYYAGEHHRLDGEASCTTSEERFHIFTFIKGEGEIGWKNSTLKVRMGESVMIPAAVCDYSLAGNFEAIKSYVPDIRKDKVDTLLSAYEAGNYNVNGKDVADRIISSVIDKKA
jgi:mannose-6-phosphate isomerase